MPVEEDDDDEFDYFRVLVYHTKNHELKTDKHSKNGKRFPIFIVV